MRQRSHASGAPAAASPAPSTSAKRAPVRRPAARRSRTRGFWIGTAGFVICLLLYVCCGGPLSFSNPFLSPDSDVSHLRKIDHGLRVTERDVTALGLVVKQVSDLATLPALEELSRTAARIGSVYLPLLEEVAKAEDLDDGGRALQHLDVSNHYLATVSGSVRQAADVMYEKLRRMLRQEPDAELALAPTSLVRTVYGWLLSNLFLYSAVLPEYYLVKDDTAAHALVLLRSLNLLSWTPEVHNVPRRSSGDGDGHDGTADSVGYDLFNWSGGAACRKGPLGTLSPQWMRFCESSFSSWAAVARRAAATYEELIVLYPSYAPLRLHYAVSFAFLAPHVDGDGGTGEAPLTLSNHSMRALQVVRNDREKLGTAYTPVEAVHAPVLALLEAYLTPVELWTTELSAQLAAALAKLGSCEKVKLSLLAPGRWRGGHFDGEYRAPVLNSAQLSALLTKAKVLLGSEHAALAAFCDCL